MTSPPIRLLDHDLLLLAAAHEQQQEGGHEEENDVHDAEGERRLQHRARFVDVQMQPAGAAEPAPVQRDRKGARAREVAAIGLGDVA